MSSWLDRWAKRAASHSSSVQPASNFPSGAPHSRRDFMKKAGIVGGVAWSIPVLQTALAPSASASHEPPACGNDTCGAGCLNPTCGVGAPCDAGVGPGQACSGGGTCGTNLICGGAGVACTGSGAGTCAGSSPCSQRPSGVRTCGGPRATCTVNSDCTNNNCAGGICGGTGATCGSEAACAAEDTGNDCPGGVCKPYTP